MEIEMDVGKHKRYASPSIDSAPAELILAGSGVLHS